MNFCSKNQHYNLFATRRLRRLLARPPAVNVVQMSQRYPALSVLRIFISFSCCMSGFCLISQSPKRLSHYFHNLLWLASQGMWRLKPAKTTSVFFSLILALLRRRGGRKKKSINRVEEGSKEGEKKFLTLTVVGEAEQRPRRPSEAAALAFRRTEAQKAVEIEAVSRGSF